MTPVIPFVFNLLKALPSDERPEDDSPPLSNTVAIILMALTGIAAFAWSVTGGVFR